MLSVVNESDLNIENGLYVIKFWAIWCGPCKLLNPSLEKLEEEFSTVKFFSVDIDQATAITKKFKIRSLPTLIFIKDGEEFERVLGVQAITPLRKVLNNLTSFEEKDESSDSNLSTG